jgi:uncharacterized protein (DUF983 family)
LKYKSRLRRRWIGVVGLIFAIVGVILTLLAILADASLGLRAWSGMRGYGIVLLIVGLVLLLLYKGRLSGLLGGKEE